MSVTYVCKCCGSKDVRRNCDAAWSEQDQRWEIVAELDSICCELCEKETDLLEVPLPIRVGTILEGQYVVHTIEDDMKLRIVPLTA